MPSATAAARCERWLNAWALSDRRRSYQAFDKRAKLKSVSPGTATVTGCGAVR